MTSTLTRAGQTTIPADIRRKVGWQAGETLDWQVEGGAVVVRRMVTSEEVRTARMLRKGGRLIFPPDFKVTSAAIAEAIREERDSR
jgi:AbrB family looped-hinge helix DNA binding protein